MINDLHMTGTQLDALQGFLREHDGCVVSLRAYAPGIVRVQVWTDAHERPTGALVTSEGRVLADPMDVA